MKTESYVPYTIS